MHKNIEDIRRLFPHCVTEAKGKDGQIQQAIDFDLLRQELSDRLVDGQRIPKYSKTNND